ncbi:MAG: indole-3-glycerol phosphate synthase TrpC [Gemmatimonadaceae bacterium]
MQGTDRWQAPQGTLGAITAEAHLRVEALSSRRHELDRLAAGSSKPPSLRDALRGPFVAVIAEVKRRSPSLGVINARLDAGRQAGAYAAGGARAVSVLTEPKHFGGSEDDLRDVARLAALPALKKDFHVDPLQVVEARALGASGILLIARAIDPGLFVTLVGMAFAMEVEPVVEVRTRAELDRALDAGARVIGVNSRDLETLVIDATVVSQLAPLIPRECIAIAESGIRDVAGVQAAALTGIDAVLVGSSISASPTPEVAVRSLTTVRRRDRND